MRNFISGPNAGRPIDFPSAAATQLADGSPILPFNTELTMSATQVLAASGELDVHARQRYVDNDVRDGWVIFEGPSIAQQWKAEYQAMRTQRGWTARYYSTGIDPYREDHEEALYAEAMGQ